MSSALGSHLYEQGLLLLARANSLGPKVPYVAYTYIIYIYICAYIRTHIYISPRTDVQALNEREESDAGITHTHEHARTYTHRHTHAHILTTRADPTHIHYTS